MKLGWLCDSILKTTAWPSPMSTTPAFSPGPWMTRGPVVGSVRSHFLLDLYEQCSFHVGAFRPPSRETILLYSAGVSPCSATSSGVMGVLLSKLMWPS